VSELSESRLSDLVITFPRGDEFDSAQKERVNWITERLEITQILDFAEIDSWHDVFEQF